jgi:hypothetical protein
MIIHSFWGGGLLYLFHLGPPWPNTMPRDGGEITQQANKKISAAYESFRKILYSLIITLV